MGDAARRRRAIRLAFDSGWGDRLVEIAQEHTRTANFALCTKDPEDRAILETRIERLRQERDMIIELYLKEVETEA